MIRMLSGFTRLPDGRVVSPASGAFTTDAATERHLISRGVAVAVETPVATGVKGEAEEIKSENPPAKKPVKNSKSEAKRTPPKKNAKKEDKHSEEVLILNAEDPIS